jgi:steroid delta-isomerase-like uncharacterized protein
MSAEENKRIAWRYYREIHNDGNYDVIDELMAPDFLFTIPTHPEPFHGPEGFKTLVHNLHSAFPDVHFTVEHLLADGDTVVGHWTAAGTHSGTPLRTVLGDIPASNRPFVIDGMTWFRMRDGKIVEALANEDTVGLLTQLGVLPSDGGPPPAQDPEQSKTLVRRYFGELMSQGNLELIDELFADNCAFRIPTLPEAVRGREGMRQFVTGLRTGFPDIKFEIERIAAEGDKAAARWTITGTHEGEFLGIPPSGNRVHDQGVDIFRIANGRIVEIYVNENDLGLLQQLGAIPTAVPA